MRHVSETVKEMLVRHDVPRGIHSVIRNDEAKVDAIVRKDYDPHREQQSATQDS